MKTPTPDGPKDSDSKETREDRQDKQVRQEVAGKHFKGQGTEKSG